MDPPGVKYDDDDDDQPKELAVITDQQQMTNKPPSILEETIDEKRCAIRVSLFGLPSEWGEKAQSNLEADLEEIQNLYDVQSMIGCGAFGCVFLAVSSETGDTVALKWFDASVDESMIGNEARFLKELQSVSGIVQFRGKIEAKRGSFLAMEYCKGKDLRHEINENGPLTEARCQPIVFQLLATLKSMHDRNILHRDIKPANLIVSNDVFGMVKVTLVDLGICLALEAGTKVRSKSGSEGYTAPEVVDESSPFFKQGYDLKADMYSVSCVVASLLQGRVYDPNLPDATKWNGLSFNAKDFVKNLTNANPDFRMTAAEAMLHPFITGNGIAPCARMASRWTQEFCAESKPYVFIGCAFALATQLS